MKLLLVVIVSFTAVATVDSTDFPDGYEDLDSADGEAEGYNSAETEHEQKVTTLPITNGLQDPDSTQKDQQLEKLALAKTGIQDSNIEEYAHHFYSNQSGHIQPRTGSRCKAKDVCLVMGGFCVTNATLCGGRLVPEGCKGSKCQCCVPGTLETMIHKLEQKLQTMQANLTNANLKLNMEFQYMRENLTDANSKLNMEFQSTGVNLTNANLELNMEFQTMRDNLTDYISNMRENLTDANSKLNMEFQSTRDNLTIANSYLNMEFQSMRENLTDANSKLHMEFQSTGVNLTNANSELNMEFQTMRENLTDSISNMSSKLDLLMSRYPVGFFFTTSGSSQRYKFYNDTTRSWTEAKEKCINEGLVIAEPDNPISLRKYLVETYDQRSSSYTYLGARGTGSNYRWERSGRQISNSDSLWLSGQPGRSVSTNNCLLMLVEKTHYFPRYPNQPYHATSCSTKRYTVCEYV